MRPYPGERSGTHPAARDLYGVFPREFQCSRGRAWKGTEVSGVSPAHSAALYGATITLLIKDGNALGKEVYIH